MPTKKLQIIGSIASNIIDDSSTSINKTWSSDKINDTVSELATEMRTTSKEALDAIDALEIAMANKADADHIHANYLELTGGEITGNLNVAGISQYGRVFNNVVSCAENKNIDEIVIKTKIPFISGHAMPLIHLKGYAYGKASPIELSVAFYIYNNVFYNTGATSACPWKPTVYLSTYTENNTEYVAVSFCSTIYHPIFVVDMMDLWSNVTRDYASGWSIETKAIADTTTIVPTDNKMEVSYQPIASNISGNAATATTAATATKATSDSLSQNISTTYIKDITVNQEDSSITITKGDSTTSVVKQPKKAISLFSNGSPTITNAGYGQFCFSSASYTPYVYAPVVQYKITGYDGYGISISSTTNISSDLATSYLHYIIDNDSNVVYSINGTTAPTAVECDFRVNTTNMTTSYIPFTSSNTWAEYNSTHSYTLCLMAWKEISLPAAESASF